MTSASCWSCGRRASAARLRVESLLRPRPPERGGPFLTFRCHGCGTENGLLRDRRGRHLLYPVEGREERSWLDRLIPPGDPERLERAEEWWLRNAGRVERFRRGVPEPAAAGTTESVPDDEPPVAVAPRPSPALRELGLGVDATERQIRRAFRLLLKRVHPDRVDQDDPVALEQAHEDVKRLRAAYESALRDVGAG